MHTLASSFSNDGKRALKIITDLIRSHAGADKMIAQAATELVLRDEADAEAELKKASRELVEQMRRDYPTLSASVVNALVISLSELIAARVVEIKACEGHA
jgi:uncharacterized protein YbcI